MSTTIRRIAHVLSETMAPMNEWVRARMARTVRTGSKRSKAQCPAPSEGRTDGPTRSAGASDASRETAAPSASNATSAGLTQYSKPRRQRRSPADVSAAVGVLVGEGHDVAIALRGDHRHRTARRTPGIRSLPSVPQGSGEHQEQPHPCHFPSGRNRHQRRSLCHHPGIERSELRVQVATTTAGHADVSEISLLCRDRPSLNPAPRASATAESIGSLVPESRAPDLAKPPSAV